jgi:hypothetical protein
MVDVSRKGRKVVWKRGQADESTLNLSSHLVPASLVQTTLPVLRQKYHVHSQLRKERETKLHKSELLPSIAISPSSRSTR